MYVYIYIYTHIYIHISHMYIYIYIEREREIYVDIKGRSVRHWLRFTRSAMGSRTGTRSWCLSTPRVRPIIIIIISSSSTQQSARGTVDEMHVFNLTKRKMFSPRPEAICQVNFNAKTHLLNLTANKNKKCFRLGEKHLFEFTSI